MAKRAAESLMSWKGRSTINFQLIPFLGVDPPHIGHLRRSDASRSRAALRALSLSLVYPNPAEPGFGLFIRSRLKSMGALVPMKVVAPVPVFDYSGPAGRLHLKRRFPLRRCDDGIEILHPRWIYPPGGTPVNLLCLFARLVWLVTRLRREFAFQVIDAHFGYPEGVVAALLAVWFRCPFIMTLRGNELMFAGYRFRRLFLRWAIRNASAIVAVSDELRQLAIDLGTQPSKVLVIPNGVDKETFHPRDRVAVRTKYGIAPQARVVVCAGELIEAKGHHLVIRAVEGLVREGHDIQLFIAGGVAHGGPPFEKELCCLVRQLRLNDRVHLLGWIPPKELAELMSAADLFCLASFSEGSPNVVNEALASGTPVAATNVGAVPNMIPTSEYGIVIPPKDQNALRGALRAALSREWNRSAIAIWGQSRSWDQVAHDVVGVIHRVVTETYVRN